MVATDDLRVAVWLAPAEPEVMRQSRERPVDPSSVQEDMLNRDVFKLLTKDSMSTSWVVAVMK